ncbi:MAG: purple acid phosphatase family protein [Armatimonadota bacterium]
MKLRTSLRITALAAGAALAASFSLVPPPADTAPPGPRAPYLQDDRGTSMTVCWTTQRRQQTQAWVRPVGEGGARTVRLPGRRLRHQVTLPGLEPGRRYEYRVRTDRGRSRWTRFRTRPADGSPFTLAAWGDVGQCGPPQEAVIRVLQKENPDFAVALGDLGYPTASERTLTSCFFRPLARYADSHVVWHVFGNHDLAADDGLPLQRASATPENGPPGLPPHRNYSFDYGSAHCVVLDASLDLPTLRNVVRPWLRDDLQATAARWKLVFMHNPIYSGGDHGDSEKLRSGLAPVFERQGVDLVFAGHDHNYQRLHPINGVTYVVSGNGGARLYPFEGPSDARTAARQDGRYGITFLRIEGDHAVLRHLDDRGREFDRHELAPRAAEEG